MHKCLTFRGARYTRSYDLVLGVEDGTGTRLSCVQIMDTVSGPIADFLPMSVYATVGVYSKLGIIMKWGKVYGAAFKREKKENQLPV